MRLRYRDDPGACAILRITAPPGALPTGGGYGSSRLRSRGNSVVSRIFATSAEPRHPALQPQGVREVDGRNRRGYLWPLQPKQADRFGRLRPHGVKHATQHLGEHGHDGRVILDEAHLEVERDVLVQMTGGVVRLGPEDRAN